ncbi:MAG: hypothetical protein HC906_18085 [Bacteroidales bacterium]|nr:hypothetical protein [Bacteroidales bacterium]
MKKTWAMLLLIFVALILNVTGNFVFIPEYGAIAAAYTSIFSYSVYFISTSLFILLSRKM